MKPMLADVGVPMIFVQMPAMVFAFIPVVIIEAIITRRWLSLSYSQAFKGSFLANLFSTLIGIPLAWLIMFLIEMIVMYPTAMAADHWHWHWINSPIFGILALPIGMAWLAPDEQNLFWMIPIASALLLVPSFFISVWLERWAYKKCWTNLNLELTKIRNAVFKANLVSYAALFVIACCWLAYNVITKKFHYW
jgi:hypothetical protein